MGWVTSAKIGRQQRGRLLLTLALATLMVGCRGQSGTPGPADSASRSSATSVAGTPVSSPPVNGASPAASPIGGMAASAPCATASHSSAVASAGTRSLVIFDAVNLRAGPGTDCPVVGSMGFGTLVTAYADEIPRGGYIWRRLHAPQGDGFAIASALQAVPASDQAPTHVPILMYHHIKEPASRYFVSPAELDEQMSWLRANGYVSITPSDLYHALFDGAVLPAKPIMISIDDGNPTDFTFQETLSTYGFRGTYFWPNVSVITEEQIAELAKTGEACGHTVNHARLDIMAADGQRAEIRANKTWLEGIVGRPVICFGYPFGRYSDETAGIIDEAGYLLAFNAWGPPASLTDANRWHIPRIEIDGGHSLDDFIYTLQHGS